MYGINADKQTVFECTEKLKKLSFDGSSLSKKAQPYIEYGVNRRLTYLEHICRILWQSPFEGYSTKNYCPNHYAEINIYINAFYIDIYGILDNLAWSIKEQFEISDIKPLNISLFKKDLFKDESLNNLKLELDDYKEWYEDFKKRRNPVAHRISLYIPIIENDFSFPKKPIFQTYFENKEGEEWNLWLYLAKDLSNLIEIINIVFKYLQERHH